MGRLMKITYLCEYESEAYTFIADEPMRGAAQRIKA